MPHHALRMQPPCSQYDWVIQGLWAHISLMMAKVLVAPLASASDDTNARDGEPLHGLDMTSRGSDHSEHRGGRACE